MSYDQPLQYEKLIDTPPSYESIFSHTEIIDDKPEYVDKQSDGLNSCERCCLICIFNE